VVIHSQVAAATDVTLTVGDASVTRSLEFAPGSPARLAVSVKEGSAAAPVLTLIVRVLDDLNNTARDAPVSVRVERNSSSRIESLQIRGTAELIVRSKRAEVVLFTASASGLQPGLTTVSFIPPAAGVWTRRAQAVHEAFMHGWMAYKRYAWGGDELKPVSKSRSNWLGGVGMQILDVLDTLWLLDEREEFDEATEFVSHLNFDKVKEAASTFELTIRAIGGLLSAHSLSGRKVFLDKALLLGERMLSAFATPSRLPAPLVFVGPSTPPMGVKEKIRKSMRQHVVLADAGSIQLEWRYLSRQTGDPRFEAASDAAFDVIQAAAAGTHLLPVYLSAAGQKKVELQQSKISMGAMGDSYYEYLLKQYQQTGEIKYWRKWVKSVETMEASMVVNSTSGAMLGDIVPVSDSGKKGLHRKQDHLACFVPGMLVHGAHNAPAEAPLSSHRQQELVDLADRLVKHCVWVHTQTAKGLAPDHWQMHLDGRLEIPAGGRHSLLRPETVESLFYLFRYTGDEQYRQMGWKIFEAINQHARVEAGFATIDNVMVEDLEARDDMQSFFLSETLKYLYLLFSPQDQLDLSQFVLNTEAHPLRI